MHRQDQEFWDLNTMMKKEDSGAPVWPTSAAAVQGTSDYAFARRLSSPPRRITWTPTWHRSSGLTRRRLFPFLVQQCVTAPDVTAPEVVHLPRVPQPQLHRQPRPERVLAVQVSSAYLIPIRAQCDVTVVQVHGGWNV